jgi:hypothetical protein
MSTLYELTRKEKELEKKLSLLRKKKAKLARAPPIESKYDDVEPHRKRYRAATAPPLATKTSGKSKMAGRIQSFSIGGTEERIAKVNVRDIAKRYVDFILEEAKKFAADEKKPFKLQILPTFQIEGLHDEADKEFISTKMAEGDAKNWEISPEIRTNLSVYHREHRIMVNSLEKVLTAAARQHYDNSAMYISDYMVKVILKK